MNPKLSNKQKELATKSQPTPCYICESSPCVCKEKDIENNKECTTCGHLKKSSPTPDGDEICPSCGGDCMDYEPSPIDQLNSLVEEAHQLIRNQEVINHLISNYEPKIRS